MKLNPGERIILKNNSLLNGVHSQIYFHGIPVNSKCNPATICLTNKRIYAESRLLHICAVDLPLDKIQEVKAERLVKYGPPINFFNPKGLLVTYKQGAELRTVFLNLGRDDIEMWIRRINELRSART